MVGAFGLLNDHHARIPVDHLVESRARIDVCTLLRCGALTEGATTELQCGPVGYSLARHNPNLWVDGTRVLVVWDDPLPWINRPWFECPVCHRRCRHVYLLDPIACRSCHRLDYASRHLHRQVPGVHRVMRWRKQIGADPRPFALLPKRPKRIVEKIRAEEANLVEHLGTITRDLERRIQVRKRKHQW